MRKIKKLFILIVVTVLVGIFSNPVMAQVDPCDGLTGKAKGLCMAATMGINCDRIEPSATAKACDRLVQAFADATGGAPAPWTVFDFAIEVAVYVDGILQFFDAPSFFTTNIGSAFQDESGFVLLSTPSCDPTPGDPAPGCSAGFVSFFTPNPIGTTVNFHLLNTKGFPDPPDPNAVAFCTLLGFPGSTFSISSTGSNFNLGDNKFTLDEFEGPVIILCAVSSGL